MLRQACAWVTAGFVLFASAIMNAGAATTAQRTFVSTGGNDANSCSLAAPCRGFAAAVTAVAHGGEVIVLDSGGYGPVVINKPVEITAPPGVYAGVSVLSVAVLLLIFLLR